MLFRSGTNENKLVEFSLAPNPVQSGTTLTLKGENLKNVSIALRDASGKIIPVKFQTEEKSIVVSLKEIAKGLYFVNIISAEKNPLSVLKLIITE